MNEGHARLCSSPEWAEFITSDVLPTVLSGHDPGREVLEIGPGYGASTGGLVKLPLTLTAVESDPDLANGLRERFPMVRVLHGRGEQLPFEDQKFTAAVCFTMLHHVHTAAVQDELFAEAARTLVPGGLFAGSDSIASPGLAEFHRDDVYNPVDPRHLGVRLASAGFQDVVVTVSPQHEWFAFSARRQG
ncbi:class I SAM-dependent methyltransferase [Angustibacter sp. McL0619]|uniref:class I SAM-dependent methyltransferase n=1 Tax=Angustibacter sp. McL0619 TaxID=3415676 RepID=UPI003CF3927F